MRKSSRAGCLVAFALPIAFALGFLVGVRPPREARAQPRSSLTIYVPAEGLLFRALDGAPVARLSRDAHGGALELFDEQGVARRWPRGTPTSEYRIDEDPFTQAGSRE